MNTRRAAVALLASLLCVFGLRPAAAQRTTRRCRLDTTAGWFKRQQSEWLSDARQAWSDAAFRADLIGAVGDERTSRGPQVGVQRESLPQLALADTTILTRLRTLASTRGSTWPTRSVVGAAGVRAVWLIAQHDSALQRTVLHRMMESGPDEALAADVAVLEDRVRLQSGRKQLYGSQIRLVAGKYSPAPIEDSAHVDMRRDAAGLPPLRQAICLDSLADLSAKRRP